MAYLVELPVSGAGGAGGDGPGSGSADATGVVKIEIDEVTDGLVQVARPGQVVARATRPLKEMLAGIRPVAENFVEGFRDMAQRPDEIVVEFGLSVSAEADVVISRTSGQANFQVTLTWSGPPSGQPAADPAA
ncbi:CU044_2847 family protein [Streptomyces albidoflavus]|uniref:CU044_2847 family protein n=1 Tax=Streptomyces albidoflavus TaxID=1886 RepID=UPI0033BE7D55